MSKESRASLGKGGQLPEEIAAKQEVKSERELQNLMASLLNQRNIYFVMSRMDKRSMTRRGTPDFFCAFPNGQAEAFEAKTPEGKLSEEQHQNHLEYKTKTGKNVHVIRSFEQFFNLIKNLCLTVN